jgi:hypothetical protein
MFSLGSQLQLFKIGCSIGPLFGHLLELCNCNRLIGRKKSLDFSATTILYYAKLSALAR